MSATEPTAPAGRARLVIAGIVRMVIALGVLSALLFGSAGTTDWPRGWLFLGLLAATFAINLTLVIGRDPSIIEERWKPRSDTKPFDRIFVALYGLATIAMMVCAGLDAGRYQWTHMSPDLVYVGLVLHVLGLAPVLWSLLTNPHLETTVRIQSDRDHQVISDGPYRYVRHPMYVGMILLYLGWTLVLQSWIAFGIAWFVVALLLVRTGLEDATLRRELEGYEAFCRRTRYRLLPGIW